MIRIRDALGTFLGIEEDFLNGQAGDVANLLVEVDSKSGIYKELEILSEFGRWKQRVEILKIRNLGQCVLRENMKTSYSLPPTGLNNLQISSEEARIRRITQRPIRKES